MVYCNKVKFVKFVNEKSDSCYFSAEKFALKVGASSEEFQLSENTFFIYLIAFLFFNSFKI